MKQFYRRIILIVIAIVSVLWAFGQNRTHIYSTVHSIVEELSAEASPNSDTISVSTKAVSQVKRGARPPVDYYAIPDSMLYQRHLIVKFHPHLEPFLENNQLEGIEDLIILNEKWKVESLKSDYDTTTFNPKFKERHQLWGLHLWYQINFTNEVPIKEVLRDYSALTTLFEIVEPEIIIHDFAKSIQVEPVVFNDPSLINQWNYHNTGQTQGTVDADIDLPEAWSIETGKKNVVVAIIDSGVDTTHTDLKPNFWVGANGTKIGYNFYSSTANLNAGNHGTHVAGTIGAVTNNANRVSGIAGGDGSTNSGVSLMICQVSNAAGSSFSSRAIKRALIWAADNGAAIAQNSWGTLPPNTYNTEALDGIDYFVEFGGGNILDKGLVIFSAGNSNLNAKIYPAAYERVIAVAATNHKDVRASYSSYGEWVDISAPGGDGSSTGRILSTVPMNSNGGIGYLTGTSQASPHVTGVAALLLSKVPGVLQSDDIRSILLQQSDDITNLNTSYRGLLGKGRINAYQSLVKAQELASLPAVSSVQNFTVVNKGCGTIQLTWKNTASKKVVIAMNDRNKGFMGIPQGNYAVGDSITTGGGKIIYVGTGNSFTYTATNYHDILGFKIWHQENGYYGSGSFDIISEVAPCSLPILYVKEGASGDGSSWAQASGDLQQMIHKAAPGTSIYIAEGTYKPTYIGGDVAQPSMHNRNNYFLLTKRIYLVGGFPNNNNQATTIHRNTLLHKTILSGDFNGDDVLGNEATMNENSYHVLVTVNVAEATTIALLDGLTITGGNANGVNNHTTVQGIPIANSNGGGWFNAGGVFRVEGLTIFNNHATLGGGWYNLSGSAIVYNTNISYNKATKGAGFYNSASNPSLYNCILTDNQAITSSGEGGAWYNSADSPSFFTCLMARNRGFRGGSGYVLGGNPLLINAQITRNTVSGEGGGLYHSSGTVTLLNSTLSDNEATTQGGGIYSAATAANAVVIGNSIVWQNAAGNLHPQVRTANTGALSASYSIIQNVTPNYQKHLYNFDPEFVDPEQADYRLSACSPAINLGDNQLLAGRDSNVDLDGAPRIFNTQIDLGSFEYQLIQEPTSLTSRNASVQRPIFSGTTALSDGCEFIAKVQEVNSSSGNLFTAEAKIVPANTFTYGGWTFVKRYFRIEPSQNADQLFARLTLYFTKEEFDSYNNAYGNIRDRALPENLTVVQFHGTPLEGEEHSYSGWMEIIKPNINDIIFNEETGIWQVSFNVYGFSGFYVSGQSFAELALPVKLLYLKANETDNRFVNLTWNTTDERNFKHFEIQRSTDGFKTFSTVGIVDGDRENTSNNYTFIDSLTHMEHVSAVYYRLKMVDLDATYNFSDFVSIQRSITSHGSQPVLYPNPSTGLLYMDRQWEKSNVTVYDLTGKVMDARIAPNQPQLDLRHLPASHYLIRLEKGSQVTVQSIIIK